MTDLNSYKIWAGFANITQQDAQPAVGVVKASRSGGGNQVIEIPKDSVFIANKIHGFSVFEARTLSETASFVPVPVKALKLGASENLPIGAQWTDAIQGISISNEQAITGGVDAVISDARHPSSYIKNIEDISDAKIESMLSLAISIVRDIIGYTATEDSPTDDPRYDTACFILCKYWIEQDTFQEVVSDLGEEFFKQRQTKYWRSQVYSPLLKQCIGLVVHLRKVSRFIPGAEDNETRPAEMD